MVITEEINGKIFVEQRKYYVYANKEDREKDHYSLSTSCEETFKANKEQAKSGDNKTVILI